jgi:pilus assembly protein Flp/PilA
MKNLLAKLIGDKSGASAAEYALILAVFGVFVVAGMGALGGGFDVAMQNAVEDLEGA